MKNYFLVLFLAFHFFIEAMEDKTHLASDVLLKTIGSLCLIGQTDAASAFCKACLEDKPISEELLPALYCTELLQLGEENPSEDLRKHIIHTAKEEREKLKKFIEFYQTKKQQQKRVEQSPTAIRTKGIELESILTQMRKAGHFQAAAAFVKACNDNKPIDLKYMSLYRQYKLLGENELKPPSNIAAAVKDRSIQKTPSPVTRKR